MGRVTYLSVLPWLIRSVGEFRADRWRPGFATLLALGTALPLVLGVARHETLLGVLGSVGALYTGLASFGNVHRVRLRRMVLTSFAVAILALLGATTHGSDGASIVLVAVVGSLFSLLAATNLVNGLVAVLGTAIFIVLSGIGASNHALGLVGGIILLGGLLQTLLVAQLGPFFPLMAEREAVAAAFESLAVYVETPPRTKESPAPDALSFREARARLEEGVAENPTEEHARLRHALSVAETIRASLVGFAQAYRGLPDRAAAQGILDTLAHDLRDLAEAIRDGRYNVLASLAARPAATGDEAFDRWVRVLAFSLESLARPPLPEEGRKPETKGRVRRFWANQPLRALSIAHALRFGSALAIGTAIFRLGHVHLGYWIPLTATFLLRPDYASTLVKGFGRFVGTLAGVSVASVCVRFLPHDPWLLTTLVILSGWLMFALYEVSFALYISALTFYVIVGLAALGHDDLSVGIDRAVNTLAGALLALVATFAWPVWQSGRLRAVFREAFQTQTAFGESLVHLRLDGMEENADELRHQARTLRLEAERLVESARLEPRWSRKVSPEEADDWTERLAANAAVLLALHAYALEQRAGRVPEEPNARASLQKAISEARTMAARLA